MHGGRCGFLQGSPRRAPERHCLRRARSAGGAARGGHFERAIHFARAALPGPPPTGSHHRPPPTHGRLPAITHDRPRAHGRSHRFRPPAHRSRRRCGPRPMATASGPVRRPSSNGPRLTAAASGARPPSPGLSRRSPAARPGARRPVLGLRSRAPGARPPAPGRSAFGLQSPVPGAQPPVPGARTALGARPPTKGLRRPAPGARPPVLGAGPRPGPRPSTNGLRRPVLGLRSRALGAQPPAPGLCLPPAATPASATRRPPRSRGPVPVPRPPVVAGSGLRQESLQHHRDAVLVVR